MAWRGLEQHIGADSWRVCLIFEAFADAVLALLVLISAVIALVTSNFVRISGFCLPCSCWECHHRRNLQSREKVLGDSLVFGNPDYFDLDPLEVNREYQASYGSFNKVRVKNHADLSTACFEESGKGWTGPNGPSELPMEDDGTPGDEAVDEDSSPLQVGKRSDGSRDRELREALQAERETMAALYLELEEERNASATAANEAMAMITRLQEEKSAVQMEARQFHRMVEEKTMYDQEAIELLKEILANREEEKFALQEEVQVCRQRLYNAQIEAIDRGQRADSNMLLLCGPSADEIRLSGSDLSCSTSEGWRGQSERIASEEDVRYSERIAKAENLNVGQFVRAIPPDQSRNETGESLSSPGMDFIWKWTSSSSPREAEEAVPNREDVRLQPSRRDDKSVKLDIGRNIRRRTGKPVIRKGEKVGEEKEDTSFDRRSSSGDNSGVASEGLQKDSAVSEDSADRTMEEKRLSVLEYVWKFEKQLGGKGQVQIGRPKSAGESRAKAETRTERGMSSETSRKPELMTSEVTGEDPLRRKLFVEFEMDDSNLNASSSTEAKGRDELGHGNAGENIEAYARLKGKGESIAEHPRDEASFVHDVYEVQHATYDSPGVIIKDERNSEGWVSLERQEPNSDRLGKPDLLMLEEADTRAMREQESEAARSDAMVALYGAAGGSGTSREWEDLYQSAGSRDFQSTSIIRWNTSRISVEDDVEQLTLRLKALEADRHLMKQTIDSLRRENGEMKLLQEIAQQLRELRGMEKKDSRHQESLSFVSSFQGMMSFARLRSTAQAQLSKLAQVCLRSVDTVVRQGEQRVGLGHLLHTSPRSLTCVTRVRKADIIPVLSEAVPSQHTLNWPKDVRTRLGTALSGWDY